MLYTSIPGLSLRTKISPCSLGNWSTAGDGEAYGVTSVSFSMKLVSWSYSAYSISMSICSSIDSSYKESSYSYGGSPCSSLAIVSESSTYIGIVFTVCALHFLLFMFQFLFLLRFLLSFMQLLLFLIFYYISYNILSASSNICLSLFICATLLSRCHLFESLSKATLSISGCFLKL